MRRLAAVAILPLLLSFGAHADMFQDAGNAKMPEAARNLGLVLSVKDYGAIGDGGSHSLSTRYGSLAEAQAVCPTATALTQEIDWCAAQAAIDYARNLPEIAGMTGARGAEIYWPPGYYMHGASTLVADDTTLYLRGAGPQSTVIQYTGSAGVNLLDFGQGGSLPRSGALRVSNMTWLNAGAGGIAINAKFNLATPTLTVDYMDFSKVGSGYFSRAIHCLACSYAVIEHNHAYGTLPGSTDFVYFEDNNTLLGHYSNKFSDNYSHSWINGYHIVNNSTVAQQGPRWLHNDHVRGQRFLYVENMPGAGSPPEYTLLDNEAQIDGYFVDAAPVQNLKAIGNEMFIGAGGMPSPVAVGGGFNLRGAFGASIIANTLSVTGTNTALVNFLTTDGQHGQVYGNIYRNPQVGVTMNGVTLEAGSIWWYERHNDAVSGITSAVIDNGGPSNNTSLQPMFNGSIITPKSFVLATDGGTTNLNCGTTLFTHTSGIAGHTVAMPASPRVGCTVSLGTKFNITALTMTGPVLDPLTTLTGTTPAAWTFGAGSWFRCAACQ